MLLFISSSCHISVYFQLLGISQHTSLLVENFSQAVTQNSIASFLSSSFMSEYYLIETYKYMKDR